ncbi:MAG TPA: tRNA pseudouridine(55) synthase TruB [Bacteroidota bacterium]|nr:tRNA pseudouridine(55) synthase TruB [Bacteroidota bacterium]
MIETAAMKSSLDFQEGEILFIDKPLHWTSFDVVSRIRGTFRVKKVGHAGTLDPNATGLLIICTGKKTKIIDEFSGLDKEYLATIELGARTASFDSETEVIEHRPYAHLTEADIRSVLCGFIGTQQQLAPMYSAVKHNGKPLYKYARKGREIERKPREVTISELDVTAIELPFVTFRIVCSKGTYIRSVADECGQKLGCGAYLKELRRTRIGNYHVGDAIRVEELHTLEPKIITSAG